ncbi:SDR family oxidoreductase [Noviherbaspirillum malthae]|uniref:SDR family oxidoreductase n=1 Tax=Noviherbaspirillum malthae TaxID=1260987 RepID=UPI00188E85CC|nr:SDR family oxidoreductase [Noviherbaspirillum malthae]
MRLRLKKISDQVIVITGATSGIGLATARMAAARGASLVLVARNEDALQQLTEELRSLGSDARYVTADVSLVDDVKQVAAKAAEQFGGFDTWINNAGVGIFGKVTEVGSEDMHRLMDIDFWGTVHGSRIALSHLKTHGGALINVGSAFADRAAALHGIYSAAKHAVKGYTDSLRVEAAEANMPVSITLITPSAIDTMFSVHAKNYLDRMPKLPPPMYVPETVASAILHACEHPKREIYVGSTARLLATAAYQTPRLVDKAMELLMFSLQKTDRPASEQPPHNLNGPQRDLDERSGRTMYAQKSSWYTEAVTHPAAGLALLAGAAVAAAVLWPRPQR